MLAGVANALGDQLASNAALLDWARTHCRRDRITTLYGNRQTKFVRDAELPALVLEIGETDLQTYPGANLTQARWPINVALVWREKCPDTAYQARVALPALLLDAVHSDVSLGNACEAALLEQMTPLDGGEIDPTARVLRFVVQVDTEHLTGG